MYVNSTMRRVLFEFLGSLGDKIKNRCSSMRQFYATRCYIKCTSIRRINKLKKQQQTSKYFGVYLLQMFSVTSVKKFGIWLRTRLEQRTRAGSLIVFPFLSRLRAAIPRLLELGVKRVQLLLRLLHDRDVYVLCFSHVLYAS